MADRSTDFLAVDSADSVPSLHRSRSGGYADHVDEQTRWDRAKREREMKRYYDAKSASTAARQPERLYVPTFDTSHRRTRSHEQMPRETTATSYNVREASPRMVYDLKEDITPAHRLPVRYERPLPTQRKPQPTPLIIQHDLPTSTVVAAPTWKSPLADQPSPTAIPQIRYQHEALQKKLAAAMKACQPFINVEAAHPDDLTFARISDCVLDFAFDLQVWSQIVHLDDIVRIRSDARKVVEAASVILDHLTERADELADQCAKAKPRDLRVSPLPQEDELDSAFDSDGDEIGASGVDVTETIGFAIQHCLDSLARQMQTLKRLTRPLQDATLGAKEELVAVNTLVTEAEKYFGTVDGLERYRIDPKFAGRKALEEARYAFGGA